MRSTLRVGGTLGKYRLEKRVGQGAYASVYRAYDTVEGIRVALKIPRADVVTGEALKDFRREVRLVASLNHPHILRIKNAEMIDGHFVVANPLGDATLTDRLARRLGPARALEYARQLLDAVAYAHACGIVHCDIKPDNVILFSDDSLRLADFGIAKVAQGRWTMTGGGTGTIGFLAPEQAFGRPSTRSDVFSVGLILCRLFGGVIPEWPYEWPPPGYDRLRRNASDGLLALIRKATELEDRKRYPDGHAMLVAFDRLGKRALRQKRSRPKKTPRETWEAARVKEFRRQFGPSLQARHECTKCRHPVSEAMIRCPWCGSERKRHRAATTFPARCPRCARGLKRDWRYCPWCHGAAVQEPSTRKYDDRRYAGRCANRSCSDGRLMPNMRYCPWCRKKVSRPTPLPDGERCPSCRSGVAARFWAFCPWCRKSLRRVR